MLFHFPVRPDRYKVFDPRPEVPFFLVTTPGWEDCYSMPAASAGAPAAVRLWKRDEELADVLATLPEPAYVLVAAPGRLVTSPEPGQVGRRKLVCVPAGSTPMPPAALAAALDAFEKTDPARLERRAAAFFDTVSAADYLEFSDKRTGTKAFLRDLDVCVWNQQAGYVAWGEQQIAPAGELSALPDEVTASSISRRLTLDGELTLRGTPIVHSGTAPCAPEDQERLYQALRCLEDAAVTLVVAQGTIVEHHAADLAGRPAAGALEQLFGQDERYRAVLEIGFGIHPDLELQPGNVAVNEVHGGRDGVFHVGIGLTPVTTYAPIVLCPDTTVRTAEGRFVAGARPDRGPVRRVKSASCGCL